LEALNNARLKIDTLEDLAAIVKHHKQKKKKCKKVVLPKPQEPEIVVSIREGFSNVQNLESVEPEQFLDAALENRILVIDKYLADGGDPNTYDKLEATPLFWACRGGHLDILKGLISRGAKISTRDKLWSTPLHVAVRTGHSDCAEHLIACGAKINAQDKEAVTPVDLVKDWQTGIRETLQMCANRQQGLARSC
ncbi:Ankyrin repeat domain-containing protein 23, partial [Ophiophagus hannah]